MIPDYLSHLSPGYHLNPRTEVERMERINHRKNSLTQMIARMKIEKRMMRMMWGLATGLQTDCHHPFVA